MKSTREATREELIERIEELDKMNYRVNKNLLETAEKLEAEKRKYKKLFNGYNQRVSDILELEKKIEDLENGDLTTVYLSGFYDGEKKWKNKIKAKKEEYQNKIDKLYSKKVWNEPVDTINKNRYVNYINILQLLHNESEGEKNGSKNM